MARWLLLFVLLLIGSTAGTPRLAMHWGTPKGPNGKWDPGELAALDAIGCFANVYNLGTMGELEVRRPGRIYLYPIVCLGTTEKRDYGTWTPVEPREHYLISDTLSLPDARLRWTVRQNYRRGCNWLLLDVQHRPIEIWNRLALNLTQACPRGVYGDSRGLTAAQYLAQIYLRCLPPWHGLWCDTAAPFCRWPQFEQVDFDQDGVVDGCAGKTCLETGGCRLDWEEFRGMSLIWRALFASGKPIVIGRLKLPARCQWQQDGEKIEAPWWGAGPDRFHWTAYWTGGTVVHGYKQIADRIGAGWTFVDACIPEWSWTQERITQYTTAIYALSLLEDGGWYTSSIAGSPLRPPLPPAVTQWRLGPPVGPAYVAPDSRHPGAWLLCREFEYSSPFFRTASVWFDTTDGRAGLTSGRIPSPAAQ